MSTLGSILNSSLKSMAASQLALSVASNNIANASDPDFTRQRLNTQPSMPDPGALGVGTGVDVLGITALRDTLVETGLRREVSAKSSSDTLSNRLSTVEAQFNDASGTGLLEDITNFFNSFQTLSQDPASVNFREQVKISANSLIQTLHQRSQDLSAAKVTADKAVGSDLTEVNRLTGQIADLTRQIKIEEVTEPANGLRDRRSALVKQLSQYVDVNELDSKDDYQLTTKDNHLLVLNDVAKPLTIADASSSLGAGIGSEIDVRDTYIPKYSASLDQLAYEITQQVNSIHSAGYDLDGNTNVDFFAPMTSATGAAGSISLSSDVAGDVRKIAASNLSSGTDNGAAMALGGLIHSSAFSGGSVTDQYSSLVYTIGSDVANADAGSQAHEALVTQLENRRQSVSGVSIDEETTQILQFQRAYQASARLIQTVDSLLQITLGLGAGA